MNWLNVQGLDFYFTGQEVKAGLLFSLLIVWVLVGLFAYLNRYTRRRYFTHWTAAWMFYALWMTLHFGIQSARLSSWIWAIELWCVGVSAVFLLWGGSLFLGRRVPQRVIALFLVFLLIWSYVGVTYEQNRVEAEWPVFGLVGLSSLFSAWNFFNYRRRRDYIGATLLMVGFSIWGAFMTALPFLNYQAELGGLILFISAALQLFLAVSMIVLVLEEARHTQQVVMTQMRARRDESVQLKSRVLSTEERYRMLFEQASEPIVIVAAADLKILELNPAAERLLGISQAEAARHSMDEFFHDQNRANTFTSPNWIQSLQQEQRSQIRRKDGQLVPVEVETSPVDLNGLFGYQLFLREITERVRLEQQLRQAEKLSALGQMISGVAHELNNPLAVIKGYLDLMLMRPDLPAQIRKDIQKVAQEGNRAAKLVQNFLSFARQSSNQRSAVKLNELLHSVVDLRKMDLLANAVDLQLDLTPELPLIYADPAGLQQVFVNIISNAMQAMQEMPRNRRLRIATSSHKQKVQVVIEDSGPGVPAHLQDRIFEPLFTTKDVGSGTGLGLSIAHGIISEHQGKFTYHPASLGGAGFLIELPIGEPQPVAPATKEPGPASDVTAPSVPSATMPVANGEILVLDDEEVIGELLGEMLSLLGYKPTLSQSAPQALELIRQHKFKAIISDFRMPGMNGRQFYETIVHEQPLLARRIIFLSGDTVNTETVSFMEATGNPHLAKPFQLAQVDEAIKGIMARFQTEAAAFEQVADRQP